MDDLIIGLRYLADRTVDDNDADMVESAADIMDAILDLHEPDEEYPEPGTGRMSCIECNRSDQEGLHPTWWPCPTVKLIGGGGECREGYHDPRREYVLPRPSA